MALAGRAGANGLLIKCLRSRDLDPAEAFKVLKNFKSLREAAGAAPSPREAAVALAPARQIVQQP